MRFESKNIESYIRIFPDKIPYQFNIDEFTFNIFVNVYSNDLYVVGFDKDGNILGNGAEKLIQDFPIFWVYQEDEKGHKNPAYPQFNLVPRAVDNKEITISRENIGSWLLSYEVI